MRHACSECGGNPPEMLSSKRYISRPEGPSCRGLSGSRSREISDECLTGGKGFGYTYYYTRQQARGCVSYLCEGHPWVEWFIRNATQIKSERVYGSRVWGPVRP